MSLPRTSVLARWIAAALVGGGGVFVLARVMTVETNWVAIFGKSLLGLAAMISGVLLIAPECVGWAVLPFHRLLDHLFLPAESAPPPLDYTLARRYAGQLRFEDACDEYAKIIRYHPAQANAYLEGISAAHRARNPEQARKFYRAARRVLRTEDQRRLLENVYAARDELPGCSPEEMPPLPEESFGPPGSGGSHPQTPVSSALPPVAARRRDWPEQST